MAYYQYYTCKFASYADDIQALLAISSDIDDLLEYFCIDDYVAIRIKARPTESWLQQLIHECTDDVNIIDKIKEKFDLKYVEEIYENWVEMRCKLCAEGLSSQVQSESFFEALLEAVKMKLKTGIETIDRKTSYHNKIKEVNRLRRDADSKRIQTGDVEAKPFVIVGNIVQICHSGEVKKFRDEYTKALEILVKDAIEETLEKEDIDNFKYHYTYSDEFTFCETLWKQLLRLREMLEFQMFGKFLKTKIYAYGEIPDERVTETKSASGSTDKGKQRNVGRYIRSY